MSVSPDIQVLHYNFMKKKILDMPYSQIALEELKESFKADINSNRAYFKIQTFKDLMKILEKRDVLNMECLNPLQKIESVLRFYFSDDSQDLQLKSPASDFQDLVLNSPVSPLNRNPLSDDNEDDDSRILCNPKVKKRVYELIGTEIGRKWRDFGRELNLRESALEELEEKYKTIKDRTYAILLFHEKNCDERYWKSELLDGLDHARRQDLRIKAQKIFDMHNT